ncbi:MAG TPA: isoprenylcysteine carboxylmethyltransferase family protein [bacterium]|nr:isoprenylcysteine carboxylmethyltransferase family protein [bacterium]
MRDEQPVLAAALRHSIGAGAVFLLFLGLVMFLPAGDIRWAKGWLMIVVFVALTVPSVVYMWRANPQIFPARSRIHEGTKGWDKALLIVLLPLLLAIYPVAALDDGRFHWSRVPVWLVVVGYVLFIGSWWLIMWVEKVNRFAEPGVRVHAGQHVIDSGPYAIVRHPMYMATVPFAVGTALALGSYWALVPAALVIPVLVARTVMEDRTLREELTGYKAYAGRVRYRLFPGVW